MEARFKNIDTIIKELDKGLVLEVGIMGEKASEVHKVKNEKGELVSPQKPLTNAFIGAVHEYGSVSRGIPARSFLRMPIRMKLASVLQKAGLFFVDMVKKGKYAQWLGNLGLELEDVIYEAFHSRGFGQWQALKPQTIKRKGSDMPLLDTGQLSASISSRVVMYED